MGKFEEIVRKKLEGHEVPYDASQWSKMEARLNAQPSTGGKNWLYGGIAAAVLIGGTFIVLNQQDNTSVKNNALTENTDNKNISNQVETHLSPADNKSSVSENNETNSAVNENNPIIENSGQENVVNNNVVQNPVNNNNVNNPVNNNNVVNPNNNNQNNNNPVVNNNQNSNTNNIPVTPSFTVSRTSICAGEAVTCRAANANTDCDLVWEFGDGQFSREAKTEHTFKNEGEYVISLRYHDKKNNKLVSKEVTQLVKVNASPKADFSYESNSESVVPTINFINLTDNAEKWNWNFGDNKKSTEKQPSHVYTRKGSYAVTLEVTNEFGCKDSKDQVVAIEQDFNLYAPNTFSPDGDGLNDDFIPKALQVMDVNFTMTIYDQRGARVYQTSRVDSPWDGRNSVTGATAPTGAYVWVVTISNPKPGQPDVYKGSVTLLR